MKKTVISILLTTSLLFALGACSPNSPTSSTSVPSSTPTTQQVPGSSTVASQGALNKEAIEVTIVDFDGKSVKVKQNPKIVAIYDYAILDILYNVGFEKTGIEMLIVPTKDTLPNDLSWYKQQSNDKVVTGGTLFYVDWDVLDLLQPDLVILGGRSFGMNASGERLSTEDNVKFRGDTEKRYAEAAFAKLSTNSRDSELAVDMEKNVAALAAIFPKIAPELNAKLADVQKQMATIHDKAQSSGKHALFAMMVDQTTLSIFLPASRFDMLYEEFGFLPVAGEAVSWTDQHGFDVRAEYVLEANPDVIFLLDRSATVGSGAGAENFLNDPIISKTRAALNDDVYILTGDAWYTMTGGFTAVETMIADINQYIEK